MEAEEQVRLIEEEFDRKLQANEREFDREVRIAKEAYGDNYDTSAEYMDAYRLLLETAMKIEEERANRINELLDRLEQHQ